MLCQDMKWTYQEYLDQPHWLIEFLNEKRIIDNKYINSLNK